METNQQRFENFTPGPFQWPASTPGGIAYIVGGDSNVHTIRYACEETFKPKPHAGDEIGASWDDSAAEFQEDDELDEEREVERVARANQELALRQPKRSG